MPPKINPPRALAAESEQVIAFLERVSELLKHQRRHFDDAVVTHCIRLIRDYVQDNLDGELPERAPRKDGGHHT